MTARAAVAYVFFAHGALFGTWVSRIPAVKSDLALGDAQLGLALLGATTGGLIGLPLAGWLVAREGSRRAVARGLPVVGLLLPLLAVAPSLAWLALALFAFGLLSGGVDVAMNAHGLAVERSRGRPLLSGFHAAWSLGGLAGAGAGAVAAWLGAEQLVHFTAAAVVVGIPALAVRRALLPAAADRPEAPTGFRRPPRRLLPLAILAFCGLFGEAAVADWSAVYIAGPLDGGAAAAALGFAFFSLAMAALRLVGDRLTLRWGPAVLARRGGALAATGLALALAVGEPAAALVGFGLAGAGLAALVPIAFRAAGSLPGVPPAHGIAALTTVGYGAFLVSPPAIGFAAEVVGLRTALWAVVAMMVAVVVLAPSARAGSLASPSLGPHPR